MTGPSAASADPDAAALRAGRYARDHAGRLRALAYRMLGSHAEAEDIVQEAWLRWAEVDPRQVVHEGAFLSKLVTHLCLDRLKSASHRREHYVGVWLPEPLLDDDAHLGWVPGPEGQAEFAQEVSLAFLLALERLSPLERAAFLLHDVFDLDYDEVGRHLERSGAACRQLVSRARRSVKAEAPRRPVPPAEHERLADAFIDALRRQDVSALARLLAEDAVLMSDGGGRVQAVPHPLHGALRIARALVGFARKAGEGRWRMVPALLNGRPGCLVLDREDGGRLIQTVELVPSTDGSGQLDALYVQRNPDKLRGVQRRLQHGRVTGDDAASS